MRPLSTSEDTSFAGRANPDSGSAPLSSDGIAVSFATSADEVSAILCHPDIVAASSEDGCESLSDETIDCAMATGLCQFVIAREGDGRAAGLFVFLQEGRSRWALHTAFLNGHRGATVLRSFRLAVALMRSRHAIDEITTSAPAFNVVARRMAVAAGFERTHVLRSVFRHGGALHDVVFFRISGDQACPQ